MSIKVAASGPPRRPLEIKFWEDKSAKKVRKALYSEEANAWAEKLGNAGGKNKPAQIRKFYDELLHFKELIKGDKTKFDQLRPLISMLNAKCAYAYGRDLVTQDFVDFIGGCDAAIRDVEDFQVALTFFEAIMGYLKYYEKLHKESSDHRGGRS